MSLGFGAGCFFSLHTFFISLLIPNSGHEERMDQGPGLALKAAP